MQKNQLRPNKGPKPLGPYSTAIEINQMLYISAQLPLNDEGDVVGDDIASQTRKVIDNIEAILNFRNLELDHVVSTTIYLQDLDDFNKVNQMIAIYFSHPYPVRTCMEVSRLPKNALVQIECVAYTEGDFVYEDDDEECDGCACE
ncbi:MAG: Rid family detoxifying hydrolase [Erysipelothrix sp.]